MKCASSKGQCFQYALYEPKLLPLEQAMQRPRRGDRVNISFSNLTCLEVMEGGVSKGHALEAVSCMLGYSLKNCIVFVDGMNDV